MTGLRQVLIILVGLTLASAMVVLGIWQLDVYQSQGSKTAAARAAAPPVQLQAVAPVGSAVVGGFGRSVSFTGEYDPRLQVLVSVDGSSSYRVLTGFQQPDGSIVPVVRGLVGSPAAPSPPSGTVTEVGVLLPSEENAPARATAPGTLDAVRLPALAQRWSGQLIGGFVTLSAADAQAQGIEPAPLNLPTAKGRLRNGAYAFQWWIFAAFALGMSIRIARESRLRDDLDAVEITAEEHSNAT